MDTVRKQRGVPSDPEPLQLTPRDIDAVRRLTRYRYLRTRYITRFVGGSEAHMATRLRKLFDHGYVLRAKPQLRIGNLNSHPEIYEIAPKGIELLRSVGQYDSDDSVNIRPGKTRRHEFFHDCYVCDILASIELGVWQSSVKFLTFYDILKDAPKETRDDAYPLSVWIDRAKNRHLTADALFGIEYENGKRNYFFLEADRDTETLKMFRHKMQAYLDNYKRIYKHFNIGNFRVLTVTVNERHMANLMEQAPNPKMFLFKTMVSFGDLTRPPEPTPALFTGPWNRKGLPQEQIDGLASETSGTGRPAKAA